MKIHTKEIKDYQGLGRAILLADNHYELVVTLDIGPRIMRFSLLQGDNVLADNVQETTSLPDGSIWKLYGGHRIWYSPEHFPRTYQSDNLPVEKFDTTEDGIIIWQKQEPWTQIKKGLHIKFNNGYVEINNQIKNCGAWPIETAAWAITVVPIGGQVVCPVVRTDTGLLPNAFYVTWPYTNLDDKRLKWGKDIITVSADPQIEEEFKFGYSNTAGWITFINNNQSFIKQYEHKNDFKYPDFGCSTEVYSSNFGMEMETLSPLYFLKPNEEIKHREYWHIKTISKNSFTHKSEFNRLQLDDMMIDIRNI